MTAFVLNLKWYINGETWPSDLQGVVFCADSNGNAKYKVLGAEVPGDYNTKFSDIDISKTSSEFYGIISNAENAPSASTGGGSGISTEEKTLLLDLLQGSAYGTASMAAKYNQLKALWS